MAGVVGTSAMSVFMEAWKRAEPETGEPIPPRVVTRGLTSKVGLWQAMGERMRTATTWVSHYGYGTTLAVAYAGVEDAVPLPPIVKGTAFGLAVWAASYPGWLPALGVLPPVRAKPRPRNALVIGAHVMWGAVLGVVLATSQHTKAPALHRDAAAAEGGGRR